MKPRTVLLILFLVLILVFAAVNWGEFTRPTSLSLVFTTVQAPLGLIMLGLTILLTAMFVAYALYLQTSMLLESRRHGKEMHAQRELAEHAESSRIAELRNLMMNDMMKMEMRTDALESATMERLDRMEKHLLSAFEENGNSVAASIGELDDRIVRQNHASPRSDLTTVSGTHTDQADPSLPPR
jgi:uncharacterized integral membrane protein